MPTNRSELISHCHYYKGETQENNPYINTENEMLWYYESRWVEKMEAGDCEIEGMLKEYRYYGVDKIMPQDDVPESLKALFYNRYSHWSIGSNEGFKQWYLERYLNQGERGEVRRER